MGATDPHAPLVQPPLCPVAYVLTRVLAVYTRPCPPSGLVQFHSKCRQKATFLLLFRTSPSSCPALASHSLLIRLGSCNTLIRHFSASRVCRDKYTPASRFDRLQIQRVWWSPLYHHFSIKTATLGRYKTHLILRRKVPIVYYLRCPALFLPKHSAPFSSTYPQVPSAN